MWRGLLTQVRVHTPEARTPLSTAEREHPV
jgi:hypothetical protein